MRSGNIYAVAMVGAITELGHALLYSSGAVAKGGLDRHSIESKNATPTILIRSVQNKK